MDLNSLQRMGRRRFMENLAGIGVSAKAISNLSQEDISQYDLDEEVPYVEVWETVEKQSGEPPVREPVYNTIDREEWERRETALNVQGRVQSAIDEYFEDQPIYSSFRPDDQSPTGFGVGIKVENDERLDFSVEAIEDVFPYDATGYTPGENPSTREKIPIVVNEMSTRKLSADYEFQDYDNVPGGQRIESHNPLTGEVGGGGTLMMKAYDEETGEEGWVTAGHVVEDMTAVDEIVGDDDSDEISQALGGVEKVVHNDPIDCAFISAEDQSTSNYITSEDNSEEEFEISGFYTNESLKNHVGEGFEVTMQGRTSGRKSGELIELLESPPKALRVDELMDDGDSGGPMFKVNSGKAYMLGDITDGNSGLISSYTQGTTVETLREELEVM